MRARKSLVVGAVIAAVTVGSVGGASVVSAATPTDMPGSSSIVDKLATKFNLNKADVQAVFDADRSAHDSERKANQAERLATAVKDGKLTQAQADYITKAQAEIAALRSNGTPGSASDTIKDQMKTKLDALRTWAKDNNVDATYLGGSGHGGGPRGDGQKPTGMKPKDTN